MNDSKVVPVEAQAVPDLPVAWQNPDCPRHVISSEDKRDAFDPRSGAVQRMIAEGCTRPLFTRPTPAAADLTVDGLMDRAKRYRWAAEGESVEGAERVLRAYAAQLVAASPAAAAGVPTEAIAATLKMASDALHECRRTIGNINGGGDWAYIQADNAETAIEKLLDALASPVAPVGAPTRLTDEQIEELAHRRCTVYKHAELLKYTFVSLHLIDFARALLSAQGCELATDATKQLGEHSVRQVLEKAEHALWVMRDHSHLHFGHQHSTVALAQDAWIAVRAALSHLAATPIDQDFRRRPASSEAAPKQPDSDSVHPAMSTSSVPTAAPLLSLSESGCSELPLRADVENGFILDERGEIVCQFWNKCEDDFAKKAENMRCIVNAMNSHDELVTALREIAEHGNAWTHEGLVMIARDALETRK